MARRSYAWKRHLLANWRDTRNLLRQLYDPLLLFVVSVLRVGPILDLCCTHATVQDLTCLRPVCAVFSTILMGESGPFPQATLLQVRQGTGMASAPCWASGGDR
jgi:hypothetical protein